ncbi:ATP-dependent RNA helicase chl1 [Terfezia claveryi]|nr:ATP-dependent RNA helicase chl1 [Terfezia claveryi]
MYQKHPDQPISTFRFHCNAMESRNEQRDFHHPYNPYPVQLDFMNALYDAIETGSIGIFESPTGTGKSLSLLCGSLTWLKDHKAKTLDIISPQDVERTYAVCIDPTEPEWVQEYAFKAKKDRLLRDRADLEERLKKIRKEERKEKQSLERGGQKPKRQRIAVSTEKGDGEDENQFLLDDYDSDSDKKPSRKPGLGLEGLSSSTKELLQKLGHRFEGDKIEADLELPDEIKIFYCSRTHSQLTQFVNELKRIKVPPSVRLGFDELEEEIKHLSLGSRKNLCINPKVQKLGNVNAINERCLELQQSWSGKGTSQEHKCQFLPAKDDKVPVRDFRDHALARVRDIEELGELGRKMGICPYYASRPAIKPSEIVTLPYPLLLQRSAREALDISLKGHVVMIDEAHNLMDAISNIHSNMVTLPEIQTSHNGLETYLSKFGNRLKGSNKAYVMQLLKLLSGLILYLEGKKGEGTVEMGDLLATNGIDQVNIYKLQKYITESKLARKVEGYLDLEERKKLNMERNFTTEVKTTPTLTHIQSFLQALTNPSSEGRIFHGMTDQKEKYLKYMLLDPAHNFKSVVEEARAVILAGGTMEPTLSCGHVIPKENLLAWSVCTGPSNRELKFTYDRRNNLDMIDDLGRAIINLCLVIPHGIVCFFPSYAYLNSVTSRWQQRSNLNTASIWERLGQRKALFSESKNSSSVEDTLRQYGQAIDSGRGGLLFSVVGGKMSEGINFNDNLGRGVIMVGLPFPNSQSAEWKAKLEYVEKVAAGNCLASEPPSTRSEFAKTAGRDFYENACMRAVNQSIGRAIRHQQDYAVIVLLDQRYSLSRITTKLPRWVGDSVVNGEQKPFAELMRSTGAFFRAKAAKGG